MIDVEINGLEQVEDTLSQIAQKAHNKTGLMRKIAGTMEKAVSQNFEEGGRPKWLGLKFREGKPLIDTETLRKSIESHYDNNSAKVGTNVEHAAIHHFGGKAGKKRKVTIPARPFLVLTQQDKDDILEDAQEYFRSIIE
ncbi:TPA: phage virion morphogenesis protein [Pasteurella multocida]|nr:phage virion morphogenesis protein [Pasteurella multocida]